MKLTQILNEIQIDNQSWVLTEKGKDWIENIPKFIDEFCSNYSDDMGWIRDEFYEGDMGSWNDLTYITGVYLENSEFDGIITFSKAKYYIEQIEILGEQTDEEIMDMIQRCINDEFIVKR